MPRLTPLVAAVFAVSVVAWSPTQDTAGPLTVGIEGPSALTETGSPFVAVIVLENKGDTALPGTLRVGLIDGWQAGRSASVRCRRQGDGAARGPHHACSAARLWWRTPC